MRSFNVRHKNDSRKLETLISGNNRGERRREFVRTLFERVCLCFFGKKLYVQSHSIEFYPFSLYSRLMYKLVVKGRKLRKKGVR